jgi:hypothetical protein
MRTFDHHEAWEMKPVSLLLRKQRHPEMAIDEFFHTLDLPQLRWYLWEGTKVLVTEHS